ncbi:ADAMTS-like protein 5 [Notechis scutatus]|uniref:ADAMTS-like protein 5 n=1 Tax=Notechis scutatus TaxID=8663 RepID=A0A6J1VMY5_9SAUR|nr:ADAMTS-like protein 5 [Notechis scutatus]
MGMKLPGKPTDSCPRCRSRPRGLWVRQPWGPASDVLNFWQLSRWRVLFLIGLVFACTVQGRNNGPLDLDRESEPPHRHQPAHGTWTHWGSWSACSSTCGDGVSFRIRRCIRLPGEEPCRAEARQYRVCEQKACPAGTAPFRAMQCALYNSRPILGGQAQYQWVPFHGAANLCDLNCLAIGHNFYYSFGRVLDGTPCSPASPELCISGRCLRAGCDGILGSEALADACGVCGGRNESCVFVQEAFRATIPASGFLGYRNVTQIPAGARQIRAMDNSRNYLALMEANQHYILNGEWAVDEPGTFEAAGTQWHYSRTADGHETLEAAGPTSEDLFIMVLFQEESLSIDYQYWGPRKQTLHHAPGEARALRQPQARKVGAQHPEGPADFSEATAATRRFTKAQEVAKEAPQKKVTPAPLRTPTVPGPCGKCDPRRGKSQRLHHYCNSDFVFRARILSKRYVGSETRYDVQVQQTYRNRFPLRSREYVWVPNTCDCPHLLERREYLFMARNHVNFEQTLNRLLLQRDGYARPWSPREDLLLREAAPRCQPGPPA